MKLYYLPGACSLASHIVLEWAGTPYETQRLGREEMKEAAYLAVNPAGAVPALEHDGWTLTQNAAILNYLAETNPGAKLGGDGTPKGHAEVNRWLGFVNSDLHPAFKPLFGTTGYLEDDTVIEKTKAHARAMVRTLFERADAHLQKNDWLAGSRSIADAYFFVMVRWAQALKIDISDLAGVSRFAERMAADPGVAKALADEGLA